VAVGYSGTPLAKKLGIAGGDVVAIVNEPAGFRDSLDVPDGVRFKSSLRGRADVVVVFVTAHAELARRRAVLGETVYPDGAIWVAWPKRASKVPTDMTEDVVRDVFLPHGLVDNKVCAIDDVWSGLRVVWRTARRR
jgi:hypothetical protein